MGLFDRIFGKRNLGNGDLGKTKFSEPMDENLYWEIVQQSIERSEDQDGQEQWLINNLRSMDANQIAGFHLRTELLLSVAYISDLWCAAYLIKGGCSDDGFEYFRNWLIARGKNVFYAAIKNPDSLAHEIAHEAEELEGFEFEGFSHVAAAAFELKTGKRLYDLIDNEKLQLAEGNQTDIKFTWQEEDPESMRVICPELFKLKWEG